MRLCGQEFCYARHSESADLRRCPARPRPFDRPSARRFPQDPADAQDSAQYPLGVRGDGYRHRSAARHCDRPGRRHRHRPQEPYAQGAGGRGAEGQALRIGRAARPDDRFAGHHGARAARADAAIPRFGLPGHRQGQSRRHGHQPRLPLRDQSGRPGERHHDAARAPDLREGRRQRRGGARAAAQVSAGARAGGQRQLRAARPGDGEGHSESDRASAREQGRAGQAARRRGRRRGRGHGGARRASGRSGRRRDRGGYGARPRPGRARPGAMGQAEFPEGGGHRRQHRHDFRRPKRWSITAPTASRWA